MLFARLDELKLRRITHPIHSLALATFDNIGPSSMRELGKLYNEAQSCIDRLRIGKSLCHIGVKQHQVCSLSIPLRMAE